MEDSGSKKLIIVLSVATLFFMATTVASCMTGSKQKKSRDVEMAKRLDVEEKLSKISSDKSVIDEKISALTRELDAQKAAFEKMQKVLVQEQLVNKSLQEELDKVSKLKDTLEEKLNAALTGNSQKTVKR
ncbi:MAG TPA: hypothetical protein PKL77_01850 [Candidatus Omnitrophota bacterium]|nr:hypothetical protein [Candidatus Omnitrophota bacterium]HPT06780.1 hypothetical protein [Candidatus Omnitrophota bacterium]